MNLLDHGFGSLVPLRQRRLEELLPLGRQLHAPLGQVCLDRLQKDIEIKMRSGAECFRYPVNGIRERLLLGIEARFERTRRIGSPRDPPPAAAASPPSPSSNRTPRCRRSCSPRSPRNRGTSCRSAQCPPPRARSSSSPGSSAGVWNHLVASISCTLPFRCSGFRFVSTQT